MALPAIEVRQLGKRFRRNRQLSIGEMFAARREGKPTLDSFWALSNLEFTLNPGEILGVIGRNGAGKSTLLKVLSRLIAPTTGTVTLRGRVASLLEVGTGFHPEMTGRENIFFNASLLKMKYSEIKALLDSIVDFSGVEAFLDMPVKRYSSGMYMRLAFSVAAHVTADIMFIDEVLAVGDATFQKKCIGKVQEIAAGGRSIIFVSHNADAIRRLCNRVLWLDHGRTVVDDRNVYDAMRKYQGTEFDFDRNRWSAEGSSACDTRFYSPYLFTVFSSGDQTRQATFDNRFSIIAEFEIKIKESSPLLNFGITLYNSEGQTILMTTTQDGEEADWPVLAAGKHVLRCLIPRRFLNAGDYVAELFSSIHGLEWLCEPGKSEVRASFSIRGGLSDSPHWDGARSGLVAPVLPWTIGGDDRCR